MAGNARPSTVHVFNTSNLPHQRAQDMRVQRVHRRISRNVKLLASDSQQVRCRLHTTPHLAWLWVRIERRGMRAREWSEKNEVGRWGMGGAVFRPRVSAKFHSRSRIWTWHHVQMWKNASHKRPYVGVSQTRSLSR